MATVLDVGLLRYFNIIFVWIFIFVIFYAGLNKFKWLTEDKGLNAIIALCVSVAVLFAKPAVDMILVTLPWFIVVIIMLFIILTVLMFMGIKGEAITEYMGGKDWSTPQYVILITMIVIVAIGSVTVFGNKIGPGASSGSTGEITYTTTTITTESGELVEVTTPAKAVESGTKATLFHPKVLGLAFLLLIMFFTINQITPKAKD